MIELFQRGGILFMSILTIELAGVIYFGVKGWLNKQGETDTTKSLGLLALVTGILGQLIGLFSAFEAIQRLGSVSPDILAGGLKISMITTIYGMIIYLIALLITLGIKMQK